IPTENFPLELNQLAKFSANDSASLFFTMSTGVLGKWKGPGKFSIEAFDHSWVDARLSDESVDELTRTILYFDKGHLFINAEALIQESYILVETPLGKVISYGGIFSLKLEEFKDSAQRNAVIECYEGSLAFTDQRGTINTLSSGNKMPIMLKDGVFKINRVELDELEQRAVSNFEKERMSFIEPDTFPKVKMPTPVDSEQKDESSNEAEEIKESYYFPVVEQIKSFNPYKKSYSDN
ncbi:MAG: hypothetical protein O2827_05800, partial [Verrucomicrobia bacterium]|nr:hypothetical protein [Verrucomicrobiota bacterium]